MSETDLQLLARYAHHNAEEAYAELVRRHLNLVYSAALRQVRSPQLAEEVAQSVFTDLARHGQALAPETVLSAWLYEVTRRTAIDVVRREIRRQRREQIATEMNPPPASTPDWPQIEPLLDEAMSILEGADRAALLLRFFENKSLREVGLALGTSDDAAQKRVSRAVDRLREFFARRGVTVGAPGLGAALSANAVSAAPASLATALASVTTVTAATLIGTTTVTAGKTIVMTALQKIVVASALSLALAGAVYEAHQNSRLHEQVDRLQREHVALAETARLAQEEREEMLGRLARAAAETALPAGSAELLRLRGEVGRLQSVLRDREAELAEAGLTELAKGVLGARRWLDQNPDQKIPELSLAEARDWIHPWLGMPHWAGTTNDFNFVLGNTRTMVKNRLAQDMGYALQRYIVSRDGHLPDALSELKPYFKLNVTEAMLERYELVHQGRVMDYPMDEVLIAEKVPTQKAQYDARIKISALAASYEKVHPYGGGGSSDLLSADAVTIKAYFKQ